MITREEYEKAKSICQEFERWSKDCLYMSLEECINNSGLFDQAVRVFNVYCQGDCSSFVFQGEGIPITLTNDVELVVGLAPKERE